MASVNQSPLGNRQLYQALRRGAKDVLTANGIQPSTRRGNKELDLALQRLAQQPYDTLAAASQAGQALGQKIVEISQAKGKTDLDGGIVRQMLLTGEIPAVEKVMAKPAKTAPAQIMAVVAEPQAKAPTPAAEPEAAAAPVPEVVETAATEAEVMAAAAPEPIAAEEPKVVEAAAVIEAPAMAEAETEIETAKEPEEAEASVAAEVEVLEPDSVEAVTAEPITAVAEAEVAEEPEAVDADVLSGAAPEPVGTAS